MKPAAAHSLLLRSLCLALCCFGGARASLRSGNHEWKKLIMVHHWPVTVCKEVEHDCRDPPDYWTIHGLWPDKAEECNGSWPFNLEEIKDLLPKMKMYWPDVIHPLNHSHFWKHEWEKHGTCAAQVDALNSQKKYFGGSLDLYQQLELNRFQILKMPLSAYTESYLKSSVFHQSRVRRCRRSVRSNCASPRSCSYGTARSPGSPGSPGGPGARGWRCARTARPSTPRHSRPLTDAHRPRDVVLKSQRESQPAACRKAAAR
ncbi:ribonuclease T2 isoform X1 [Ursus maritimus]|uniref:Ribonuclease T2 n=1 Tax=Ursus maritimus TaxID=29073 RepID=A0A384BWR5_URSMA|nr:ribonuclease T2 isoform X1 [Ursus maritimus]